MLVFTTEFWCMLTPKRERPETWVHQPARITEQAGGSGTEKLNALETCRVKKVPSVHSITQKKYWIK